MKKDFYYPSADGETQIHGIEWIPEKAPKAILQICHGMVEHIARYHGFAEFLNQQGFYVVGNDHLGHGASVTCEERHGYFHATQGNAFVIQDIHHLRELTMEKYPSLPYFMLGHSMGSFLIRQYIEMHGEGLAGTIIMGTGSQPGLVLKTGKFLCKCIAARKGWEYRSNLVDSTAFGSYNKKFEPARTPSDWLTKDKAIVDAYRADPWCTFRFTLNAYYFMFSGMEFMQKKENIAKIPKNLPLFLVSGEDDPVGSFGKGVRQVYDTFQKAGIQDVQMKLYPTDRHEILNELDKEQVYEDLYHWMAAYMT